jgi:hypothetical protein
MSHWTFQSLTDEEMTITACCHRSACNHHQKLNLEKLRDRFGPDAPAMADDLVPKLKCARCGGRKVGVIYAPDSTKTPNMWDSRGNAYAKAAKGG